MATREVRRRSGSCGSCARFERLEDNPIRGRCAALSPDKIRLQGNSACRSRYSPIGEPLREVPRCGICGAEIIPEGRGTPRRICLKCEAERDMEAASSGAARHLPLEGKAKKSKVGPAVSPLRGMSLSRVAALAHRAHMTYGQYVSRCEAEGKIL